MVGLRGNGRSDYTPYLGMLERRRRLYPYSMLLLQSLYSYQYYSYFLCSYFYSRCLPTPTPILQFLYRCGGDHRAAARRSLRVARARDDL